MYMDSVLSKRKSLQRKVAGFGRVFCTLPRLPEAKSVGKLIYGEDALLIVSVYLRLTHSTKETQMIVGNSFLDTEFGELAYITAGV